jgi:hypothetical protein
MEVVCHGSSGQQGQGRPEHRYSKGMVGLGRAWTGMQGYGMAALEVPGIFTNGCGGEGQHWKAASWKDSWRRVRQQGHAALVRHDQDWSCLQWNGSHGMSWKVVAVLGLNGQHRNGQVRTGRERKVQVRQQGTGAERIGSDWKALVWTGSNGRSRRGSIMARNGSKG